MTFKRILSWYSYANDHSVLKLPDNQWIPLIIKAVPALKYTGRAEAAIYFELDTQNEIEKLPQDVIKHFILNHYDFDAIDISRIAVEIEQLWLKEKLL